MTDNEKITLDSIVCQSDRFVQHDIDGEIVLMEPEEGTYFGLDPIGARILALMKAPISIRSICETLLIDYKVHRDVLETDVLELIETMAANEIVTVTS